MANNTPTSNNPFDLITEHLSRLEQKVDQLASIHGKQQPTTSTEDETPMLLEEAAKFCGMAKQTFYQQTNKIPHHKLPGTKRLIFFKSELLDYIRNGHQKSDPSADVKAATPVNEVAQLRQEVANLQSLMKNKLKDKVYRMPNYRTTKKLLIETHGGKCVSCGTPNLLTIDHIKPRSLGGTDSFKNLQLLCRKCNSQKGTKYKFA